MSKIYGYIREAGLPMYESNGLISFCGPEFDPGRPPYPGKPNGPQERLELMDRLLGQELLAQNITGVTEPFD